MPRSWAWCVPTSWAGRTRIVRPVRTSSWCPPRSDGRYRGRDGRAPAASPACRGASCTSSSSTAPPVSHRPHTSPADKVAFSLTPSTARHVRRWRRAYAVDEVRTSSTAVDGDWPCYRVFVLVSIGTKSIEIQQEIRELWWKISPIQDWRSTPTYCQLRSHVTQKLGQKSGPDKLQVLCPKFKNPWLFASPHYK